MNNKLSFQQWMLEENGFGALSEQVTQDSQTGLLPHGEILRV